ncbi:DUF4870 domain-containing protein [Salinicoccus luteus]|uniref:DUF4870 domain-containing protein n=1 Tax=Salinicoccus luteus TaxID=367840 RepID=UPI00146FA34C|nr:DUF4870 domain-containing protein [Salinicoccus luteus]
MEKNTLSYETEAFNEVNRKLSMALYIFGILTWFIGPLILFLMFRKELPFFRQQGKAFFNFYLSFFLYFMVLSFFAPDIPILNLVLVLGVIALNIILLVGAVKLYRGEKFVPPLSLKFFK